jgi:hypothetical protein
MRLAEAKTIQANKDSYTTKQLHIAEQVVSSANMGSTRRYIAQDSAFLLGECDHCVMNAIHAT